MHDLYSFLMQTLQGLFYLLIFPGGLFALSLGLLFKGLDRKIEARFQRRVGPPILQPFIDCVKLGGKEEMVPRGAPRAYFVYAPLLGFVGMAVCAALLPIPGVTRGMTDMGDLLVYFYLMPVPAFALMMAGSSSGSPFGALGFSREMTIMLAYEIPLLLVILAVALMVGENGAAEFSLNKIVEFQLVNGSFGLNPVMIPALLAYLMFLPGTMGVPPFDIPEAETEILEGPLLEYSGAGLAFFTLTSAIKTIVVLGLGVVLFFPGTLPGGILVNIPWFVLKCFMLMLLSLTFVKVSCARIRIDQAFKFYIKCPTPLAALSLVMVWVSI